MGIPYHHWIARQCSCKRCTFVPRGGSVQCECGAILNDESPKPEFNLTTAYHYADKYIFHCQVCYDELQMTEEFADGIEPSEYCSTCGAIYIFRNGEIIQNGFSEYRHCPICGDPWPVGEECRKVKAARAEGKL